MSSVREDIAIHVYKNTFEYQEQYEQRPWETLCEDEQESWRRDVDAVCSHPRIAILSEDQSLPRNPLATVDTHAYGLTYHHAQEDMLKANWVRIEVEE